jgi:hypothetical protein
MPELESPSTRLYLPDSMQSGGNALSLWICPEPNKGTEDGEIIMRLRYDASLLEHSFVEQIANHYKHLLTSVLSSPQTPLSSLHLSATFGTFLHTHNGNNFS